MKKVFIKNKDGREWQGRMEDPSAWIDECQKKKKWGEDGEYTIEIKGITEEEKSKKDYAEALKALGETDWYVLRKYETGKEIPPEIVQKRELSRKIVENRNKD